MNLVQFLKLLRSLALEHKLVDTKQLLKIFQEKLRCSIHEITDMKEHPKIYQ